MCERFHNSTLASFDITNLYTNIPIAETLEILENMLKQNNTPQHTIIEIINITNAITKQNYFTHNNKYYTQPGLPMGSPIPCILAEIFIHNIEQTHILNPDNNKQATKILYWHRYVDDIMFIPYNGNTRQITQLHNHINKLHPKLKFTLETETNKSSY